MTIVKIVRSHHKIVSFSVEGHAGAGQQGNDMVCAIASTASQYAVLGLEEVVGLSDFSYTIDEGFLNCALPENLDGGGREKADVLLETMVLVFRQAEEQFPQYIKLIESEV